MNNEKRLTNSCKPLIIYVAYPRIPVKYHCWSDTINLNWKAYSTPYHMFQGRYKAILVEIDAT